MAGKVLADEGPARATASADGVPAYSVHAERDGKFWLVHVPAVDRWTQARTVAEIEPMARDLIRIMQNLPADAAGELVMDVELVMPPQVNSLLAEARHLTELADTLRHSAGARTRQAAAELHASGLSFRDIGSLLKVSHQRVHQLVAEAAEELWLVEPLVPLFPGQATFVGIDPSDDPPEPSAGDGDCDGPIAGGTEKPASKRGPVRPAPSKRSRQSVSKAVAATSTAKPSNGRASMAAKSEAATSAMLEPETAGPLTRRVAPNR